MLPVSQSVLRTPSPSLPVGAAAPTATGLSSLGLSPADFNEHPWSSLFQKSEYETVARNCMLILKRTGNTWRQLTPAEYSDGRAADGAKTAEIEKEMTYFRRVVMYTSAPQNAREFSPTWAEVYRLNAHLAQRPMPTVTIIGLHATMPLSSRAVDELFAAVAVLEAGGSTSRLSEFLEAQLREHGFPPLPMNFCWEFQGDNTLLIQETTPWPAQG